MSDVTRFSLFKRSNGIYYITFAEQGQRRWKSTGCRLKPEALKALTEFQELLKTKLRTIRLSAFVRDYLEYARVNHAKGTVDIARIALCHLLTVTGDCVLSALTLQHLDRYKSKRLGEVKPSSVNVELRALRTIFNVAFRWSLVESNPFSCVKLVKVPDTLPPYLSKEDFQKLLNLVNEEWLKEIILFGVLTGMRRREILNLRWQDVDLRRRVIHIQSNPTFKTKQGKRRTLPLSEIALQLLTKRANRFESEYVFTQNGRKIAESWLSHRFKHYVRKALLPESLHFHSLRHTFASWLVQDGASLYEVQRLLGHSDISVTQIYSHLQPEQLHQTVNRIRIPFN